MRRTWVVGRLRNGTAFAVALSLDPTTRRIVDAAPLIRSFVGQPLANLLRWKAIAEAHIEP